jgi:hypothetical protein
MEPRALFLNSPYNARLTESLANRLACINETSIHRECYQVKSTYDLENGFGERASN